MHEINNCTRCGKELNQFRISFDLRIKTDRLKDNGIWENIPNLTQDSAEVLCPECFDTFVDIMSKMNIPHEEDKDDSLEKIVDAAIDQCSKKKEPVVEQDVVYIKDPELNE